MKNKPWIALVLFTSCSLAATTQAQDLVIRLNGKLYRAVPLTVIDVTTSDVVPTDPTDPTPPIKDTERAKRFEEVADQINDKQTATRLTGLFMGLSSQSQPGRDQRIKTPEKLQQAAEQGVEIFVSNNAQAWEPFVTLIRDEWTSLVQESASLSEYVDLCDDVAAGLSASAGIENQAFDFGVITQIIEILIDDNLKPLQKGLRIVPLLLQLFAEV